MQGSWIPISKRWYSGFRPFSLYLVPLMKTNYRLVCNTFRLHMPFPTIKTKRKKCVLFVAKCLPANRERELSGSVNLSEDGERERSNEIEKKKEKGWGVRWWWWRRRNRNSLDISASELTNGTIKQRQHHENISERFFAFFSSSSFCLVDSMFRPKVSVMILSCDCCFVPYDWIIRDSYSTYDATLIRTATRSNSVACRRTWRIRVHWYVENDVRRSCTTYILFRFVLLIHRRHAASRTSAVRSSCEKMAPNLQPANFNFAAYFFCFTLLRILSLSPSPPLQFLAFIVNFIHLPLYSQSLCFSLPVLTPAAVDDVSFVSFFDLSRHTGEQRFLIWSHCFWRCRNRQKVSIRIGATTSAPQHVSQNNINDVDDR